MNVMRLSEMESDIFHLGTFYGVSKQRVMFFLPVVLEV